MTLSDGLSIVAIITYFLLGSYAIFMHKIYGYTYTVGAMIVAGLGLTLSGKGVWQELAKFVARIIIFYSVWRLIQRRGDEHNHYDKEK